MSTPAPYLVQVGSYLAPHDDYTDARTELLSIASEGHAPTTTLWDWTTVSGVTDPVTSGPLHIRRLITLENPSPTRYDIRHTPECDDRDPGCYACPRTTLDPYPWVNHFAGLTLSPLFHLSRATRARLNALGWPAPADADGWLYPRETNHPADPAPVQPPTRPAAPAPRTVQGIDVDHWAAQPESRVDADTLARRLTQGWSLVDALSTPLTGPQRSELIAYRNRRGEARQHNDGRVGRPY